MFVQLDYGRSPGVVHASFHSGWEPHPDTAIPSSWESNAGEKERTWFCPLTTPALMIPGPTDASMMVGLHHPRTLREAEQHSQGLH